MHDTLHNLLAKLSLTPQQTQFFTSLSSLIEKPEFDLLDFSQMDVVARQDHIALALPHRHDPGLVILVALSSNSLRSLQVWELELISIFSPFSGSEPAESWVLKIAEILRGR